MSDIAYFLIVIFGAKFQKYNFEFWRENSNVNAMQKFEIFVFLKLIFYTKMEV